jgi:hypothetical protein
MFEVLGPFIIPLDGLEDDPNEPAPQGHEQ